MALELVKAGGPLETALEERVGELTFSAIISREEHCRNEQPIV
jgi:hypothetical protein